MDTRTHGQSNNSGDYAQSSMSRDNFFPMCFYTKPVFLGSGCEENRLLDEVSLLLHILVCPQLQPVSGF
jgi:hypothetical protein